MDAASAAVYRLADGFGDRLWVTHGFHMENVRLWFGNMQV